jgi:hypothetical protein
MTAAETFVRAQTKVLPRLFVRAAQAMTRPRRSELLAAALPEGELRSVAGGRLARRPRGRGPGAALRPRDAARASASRCSACRASTRAITSTSTRPRRPPRALSHDARREEGHAAAHLDRTVTADGRAAAAHLDRLPPRRAPRASAAPRRRRRPGHLPRAARALRESLALRVRHRAHRRPRQPRRRHPARPRASCATASCACPAHRRPARQEDAADALGPLRASTSCPELGAGARGLPRRRPPAQLDDGGRVSRGLRRRARPLHELAPTAASCSSPWRSARRSARRSAHSRCASTASSGTTSRSPRPTCTSSRKDYRRKQTVATGERFVTEELVTLETGDPRGRGEACGARVRALRTAPGARRDAVGARLAARERPRRPRRARLLRRGGAPPRLRAPRGGRRPRHRPSPRRVTRWWRACSSPGPSCPTTSPSTSRARG